MRGRSRGNQERILALAHQTEVFARQAKLKPLKDYMKPGKVSADAGAAAVIAMLGRLKGVNVQRLD